MRQTTYPSTQASAAAFYEEALRHLNDAYFLLGGERYPAAFASAHKAQELAIKAALIQENAMGVYGKLFDTHKPLENWNSDPAVKQVYKKLDNSRRGLSTAAHDLEILEPTKDSGINAEYPFHSDKTVSYVSGDPIDWVSPATHFTESETKKHYSVAREVVIAISTLYAPDLRPGAEPIPDAA